MALLQIAEPGESPLPHQTRHAIGIDLGTTNSLVASVRSGMAHVMSECSGLQAVVTEGAATTLGLSDSQF